MALHFRSGTKNKDYNVASPEMYKKAIRCAQSFDWEEVPVEVTNEDGEFLGGKNVEIPEWPKKLRCKISGMVAVKMRPDDPVMFVNDNYLLLDIDEAIAKDIIE